MPANDSHRARAQRDQGALAVLRRVHEHPGLRRAEVARSLDLASGSAAEILARLRERGLVAELEGPATGGRGRPSPVLVPHPLGPVVCAVEVSHTGWRMAAFELGATVLEQRTGTHRDRSPASVIDALRGGLRALAGRWGDRIAAVSMSMPGITVDGRVAQAATFGWFDVDLAGAIPRSLAGRPWLLSNDATLAGVAEARRGSARGVSVALYLDVEVGLGGVLVHDGVPTRGATGAAGEFGHLPFGDSSRRCPCGAYGCWGLDVDGTALARSLGRSVPRDPRGFAARTIAAAQSGGTAERAAVDAAAASLGRGAAGLVNAEDPDLVVLGGDAIGLLAAGGPSLRAAYRSGLMRHRRPNAPALVAAELGDDAALIGAAEAGFDEVMTSDGLGRWDDRSDELAHAGR